MPGDRSTERAMDAIEEDEVLGTISTPRHEVVRYRIGHDSGDVFETGGDYDGPTLVLEVSGTADAKAMLDAISTSAARIEALEREIATDRALADKAIGAEQARATAAEAALAAAMEDVEAHKMALQVAMRMLSPYMPGDSRAVPDEFVACAAVECGLDDGDGRVFDCLKAALEPNPAAQDRENALIADMLERAAQECDKRAEKAERQGRGDFIAHQTDASAIRSLATPAQTDALAARDAKMRAEGMRMAAEIVGEFDSGGQHYDPRREASEMWIEIYSEIIAAAEKEAGHD